MDRELSVSALSDRWCEPACLYHADARATFQYPLCRIVGVNCFRSSHAPAPGLFQYPLCRIVGVNTGHPPHCPRAPTFQYPLCRIVGVNVRVPIVHMDALHLSVSALSDRWCELYGAAELLPGIDFQYPLCRIVGVNLPRGKMRVIKSSFSIRSVGSLV